MQKRSAILAAALLGTTLLTATTATAGSGIEPITSVRVAAGLTRPIFATHAPGDYKRLYVIQKRGQIRIVNLNTGVVSASSFMDIDSIVGGGTTTNNEQGLLGLAFHPDFKANGFFYVYYTNNSGNSVIARYRAKETSPGSGIYNPDIADVSSAFTIMTFSQPFSNHNGGWIGFGPNDGYLYIATGDGGSAGDPSNRAQDITSQRLGKMLRLDVDGGSPYAVPADNPFVGVTGDDEIWAYGLRNPWRPSFDRDTGDLYIADVGQFSWEEISYQSADSAGGENYGWRCREGMHNFTFTGACFDQTFTEPFHEYPNPSQGRSITGGYVYRGCAIPSLRGTYFFADYVSARIWSVDAGGTTDNFTIRTSELVPDIGAINNIASFGEDARGEIYICDQSGGEIFKIVPVKPTILPADLDCNGAVDFTDLLTLLAAWGECDGCLPDLDGDDMVGFADLLAMLASWG
ncbi:MAG: hypothetical protein HKO59_02975 [Phycisphaerales bacterium]|nr:PQQ-dependent sugar dehydrogenase [Phycisphaerae bacterium]NNF43433.1 hypothetical protein [Phycisphaerales bacterium]NNM24945.1 hypothetical protein [Phycisphaerales bacterium]